ncbi:hypothetical protein GCM10010440_16260 [Kitasatospora cinereorecta]
MPVLREAPESKLSDKRDSRDGATALDATFPNRTPLTCGTVERLLCELWEEHFGRPVSPYDDFYELGGDSLSVVEIVTAARRRGLAVRSSAALRYPTPARLAEHLTPPDPAVRPAALLAAGEPPPADTASGPVPITDGRAAFDDAEPLYVVHSDRHTRAEREAVAGWTDGRAAFGQALPAAGTAGVEAVAEYLLAAVRAHRPGGPYRLAGFDQGAVVALELARRLAESGEEVALLAMVAPPPAAQPATVDGLLDTRLAELAGRLALTGDESAAEIRDRALADHWYDERLRPEELPARQRAWAHLARSVQQYPYPAYAGRAVLFTDGEHAHPAERAWTAAGRTPDVHRFDHGLRSPLGVIRDPLVAETTRKALKE